MAPDFQRIGSHRHVKQLSLKFLFIVLGTALCVSSAHAYEVWLTDQSDTAEERGGYLYVFDGAQLAANVGEAQPTYTIDLSKGINAFCKRETGKAVRRPHMIFFTGDQRYAVISFLTGQVLFMDAASKTAIGCVSMGKNVHAAWPTPDQRMAVAANIAEKKFVRIWTDYAARTFSYEETDVLNLAEYETKNPGESQPGLQDNAPICPITEDTSSYAFVTLRGGGLLVVDVSDPDGLEVVDTATLYDSEIVASGCGGVQVGNTMYINSGGGWTKPYLPPYAYDVYAIDMTRLRGEERSLVAADVTLVSKRNGANDSHGMVGVNNRYVWVVDRAGNDVEIIDATSKRSVGTVNLVGSHSPDPAPDLIGVSPDNKYVFTNLRGAIPLTGNNKNVNNAKGSTPGIMVVKVKDGGRGGEVIGLVKVSNIRNGVETADTHGLAVRAKGEADSVVSTYRGGEGRERALRFVLAGMGRTLAMDVVEVLGGRLNAGAGGLAGPAGSQLRLAGRAVDLGKMTSVTEVLTATAEMGIDTDVGTAAVEMLGGTSAGTPPGGVRRTKPSGNPGVELALTKVVTAATKLLGTGQDFSSLRQLLPQDWGMQLGRFTPRSLLKNSSFQLAFGEQDEDGAAPLALWGRGSVNGFSGRPVADFSMDGKVLSGYVGLDYQARADTVLGVALSQTFSEVDYKGQATEVGEVQSTLTSVYPYAHWTPRQGLGLWGLLGYGGGEVELTDDDGSVETDLEMRMAAAGIRQTITRVSGIDLAVKSDAFFVEMESEAQRGLIQAVQANANRMRLLLEGSTAWTVGADAQLSPDLAIGVRWDDGDAENGFGTEVSGGMVYAHTRLGVTLNARGRYLLVHESSEFEEWGASVTVRLEPPDGQGLTMSLAPVWGQTGRGGGPLGSAVQVPVGVVGGQRATPTLQPDRMDLMVGYRMGLWEGRGQLTPFGEFELGAAQAQRLRLGTRLDVVDGGKAVPGTLWLELAGEQGARQGAETPPPTGWCNVNLGVTGNWMFSF